MSRSLAMFDLDGTLVDTLYDIAHAANAALTDLGFPTHAAAGYVHRIGWGIRRLAELALPEAKRSDRLVDALADRIVERYRDTPVLFTRVYPCIRESLHALAARGVALAVLSNKPDELVRTVVRRTLAEVPFVDVRGAQLGVARKPSPDAVLDIARRAGIPVGHAVLIGDGETDMEAGRAAGVAVWAAGWGYRDRETLADAGAMLYLNDPFDLYQRAKSNRPFLWTT